MPLSTKAFQLPNGVTAMDLEDIDDGAVVLVPVTAPVPCVTSVLGITGNVTNEDFDNAGVGGATDAQLTMIFEDPDSTFRASQLDSFVTLVQLAKDPDLIVAGAIVGDPMAAAEVIWPGDVPGLLTITERHASLAVNAYNITYGDPVTKTFTQPAIARASSGKPTNVPQIVVS
jgi:hypothetical protein